MIGQNPWNGASSSIPHYKHRPISALWASYLVRSSIAELLETLCTCLRPWSEAKHMMKWTMEKHGTIALEPELKMVWWVMYNDYMIIIWWVIWWFDDCYMIVIYVVYPYLLPCLVFQDFVLVQVRQAFGPAKEGAVCGARPLRGFVART